MTKSDSFLIFLYSFFPPFIIYYTKSLCPDRGTWNMTCDTMSHLLMGNYRIYLAGGWGWWWREEPAGGTHPGGEKSLRAGPTRARCARPGTWIVRSACGRDPPWGGKISSTWSCITGALILPHCYYGLATLFS